MAKNGEQVGKMILFFGCRRKEDDFVYEKEWEVRIAYRYLTYCPYLLTLP